MISWGQLGLRIDCGFYCTGGTGEHGQEAVAGHIDDAAAIRFDVSAEDVSVFGDGSDGGGLVFGHQPRITRDVRREDSSQLLFSFHR